MKLVILLAVVAVLVQGILSAPLTEKPVRTPQGPKDEEDTPGTFQGDMMLTDEQRREIMQSIDDHKADRQKRKAVSNENYRWPLNIVPYEISASSGKTFPILNFMLYGCFKQTLV